eukprot:TRINITY_DN14724_c0_g3_i1.p1 TRINITY_DN14724_c0_g3~~TRINITY_DN14724_c0_g3_i1.p1  ORF type:complete len:628 (-),score=132.60 TRINITY_DN14724_c0_g3_i1:51-1934(-)
MEKQKSSKLCEVCETEQADVTCKECSAVHSFCKCCFDLSHRSTGKRAHIPRLMKSEVKDVSIDLSLQMHKCPVHPLEGLKYICTECKTVACADCFAIGSHIKHIPKSFEEAIHLIISKFAKELENTKRTLVKARSVSDSIEKEREKDIEAFSAFDDSLKQQFKLLHNSIDKKLQVLLSAIQEERKRVMKYYEDSAKKSGEITSRLANRVSYLTTTMGSIAKEATPANYARCRDLAPDALYEAAEMVVGEISGRLALREKHRVPPQVSVDDAVAAISSLDFAPNKSVHTDCSFNRKSRELEIVVYGDRRDYNGVRAKAVDLHRRKAIGEEVIENNRVAYGNYAMNKEHNDCRLFLGMPWNFVECEVYKPAVDFTKTAALEYKTMVPMEGYAMIARDCITGAYYLSTGFNSSRNLLEYGSLDDFLNGRLKRKVVLEHSFDGWYIGVKNGRIYFNLSGTNKIAVADLSTGKTIGVCNVPYALCRNGPGTFSHRGYTDLAVFCDERTEKLYVAYETQDPEFKLTEIEEGGKDLRLLNTWSIKGERKGFYAFAFVYDSSMYLGASHKELVIDRQFSIREGKVYNEELLRIKTKSTVDVHLMQLFPEDGVLICCMSEPYRAAVFNVDTTYYEA